MKNWADLHPLGSSGIDFCEGFLTPSVVLLGLSLLLFGGVVVFCRLLASVRHKCVISR